MQPVTFCVLLLTAGHVCYSQESKSGPCDLANSSALHDSALAAPEQHRYDAALLGFQRAPSAYPAQRVILGDAYFTAQRFPEARAEYERVLKVDPNQADTIEIKGNIEYLAGASEEAESTFIGLLDKHPNKVTTLRKRSPPHRKLPIETLMALRNFYLGARHCVNYKRSISA
jgi:tetratricopeptide (TPR) repeat protein